MVFYRDPQGRVAALEDRCPHRGAPLSLGRVDDGRRVCGYHGLAMGCDGRTVAMPGQRAGAFAPIRAFPSLERHGFVWVWPGDAALARDDALPALPWADDPGWAFGGGLYRIDCGDRLMIDNLMDLTHETYAHADSIGQREIDEAPCTTTVDGDRVVTRREMRGIPAPPFWQMALPINDLPVAQPVDRWQICRFTPPSHGMIDVGVALAGAGGIDAPDDRKAAAIVFDSIAPETGTSIWYFWGMARHFKPHDAALTAQIREGQGRIFEQDRAMLEQQQLDHLRQPARRLMNPGIDAGGAQTRRVSERHLAAEGGAAPDVGSTGSDARRCAP